MSGWRRSRYGQGEPGRCVRSRNRNARKAAARRHTAVGQFGNDDGGVEMHEMRSHRDEQVDGSAFPASVRGFHVDVVFDCGIFKFGKMRVDKPAVLAFVNMEKRRGDGNSGKGRDNPTNSQQPHNVRRMLAQKPQALS